MTIGDRVLGAATVLAVAALCVSVPAVAQQAGAARSAAAEAACAPARTITARIVERYPHDPTAFTQGLLWHDGALYESTGKPGESDIRRVDLETGRVEDRQPIPPDQFGEGLAHMDDELVGLTWHHGVAHRLETSTLRPIGRFRYQGQGWGLTSDGKRFIRSDGSAELIFHDAEDFGETGRVTVRYGGRPLRELNELEWIGGRVWANVWMQDWIAVIDPASGCVEQRIDLGAAVREAKPDDLDSVLNGIAWDARTERLFVTGKYWPLLFEISVR